ncbi:hypothetical protein GCM10012319_57430 [Comamonas sp. KCTC 72670]|nr:hypothetical protein GCM10012319_57430 [Comamonas sp. KCTC 72670]
MDTEASKAWSPSQQPGMGSCSTAGSGSSVVAAPAAAPGAPRGVWGAAWPATVGGGSSEVGEASRVQNSATATAMSNAPAAAVQRSFWEVIRKSIQPVIPANSRIL